MTTNTIARKTKRAAARTNACLIRLHGLIQELKDLSAGQDPAGEIELKKADDHLKGMGETLAGYMLKATGLTPEQLEAYK